MASQYFGDEEPSNVSFGTTTFRKCFPTQVPPSRFGNQMNPITGTPHRGPGLYNVEELTNFVSEFNTRPMSNKGYMFGARTSARFSKYVDILTPDPTTYQPDTTRQCTTVQDARPFNVGARRDQSTRSSNTIATPGPGVYNIRQVQSRQVKYHQSFGGNPIDLPDVSQHSTIESNTEKLRSTKEEKLYHRRLAYLKLHY